MKEETYDYNYIMRYINIAFILCLGYKIPSRCHKTLCIFPLALIIAHNITFKHNDDSRAYGMQLSLNIMGMLLQYYVKLRDFVETDYVLREA